MRLRSMYVLVFVLALTVFAADFTVGCGQGYINGPVTQKYVGGGGDSDAHMIAVNGEPFSVPIGFWNTVRIGDMVRFNGREWLIVKKAQTGTP